MIFNKDGNGTVEINAIATWTANHDYRHISKALELAKRKLLFIIGKETYTLALTHYLSDDYLLEAPTEEQKKLDILVSLMQTVLVNFAYSKEVHKGSVMWDNSGIKVNWDDKFRPAQDNTLDKLTDSLNNDAYEFLDLLIVFLKEDETLFVNFKNFYESKMISGLFINDAEDFNFYHYINSSVAYFFELQSILYRVQTSHVKTSVTQKYYDRFVDYQKKRKELEATTFVESLDMLPTDATERDICHVLDTEEYFQFTSGVWVLYAYHPVLFENNVKTALVNYTIYYKELENISRMQGRPDQMELLRANLDHYKNIAETALAKITTTIEEVEADLEEVIETNEEEETEFYTVTNNSFSI